MLQARQQVAYPFRVDSIVSIKDGYTIIQEKQKKGIVDSVGRLIVPVSYDNVSIFHEGIALLIKNERIGYVTRQGRIIAEPEYLSGTYFRSGKARVKTRFMQYTIDEHNRKIEKNLTSLSYVIIGSFITLLGFYFTLMYRQSRHKQVF
ncbi:hypothetical protein BWI93_17090 [Siphonobacter sp. BAB-5385]|uniref:WG repeat-containing protein n=1 Tax=Siphonobacter sp. BAB-5385 TaxID=1864822 RepID=UPI000B9DFC4E|nr:WG repeat-containing protein [Siphonobacter sp. BAB-5385]OZI07021.1 hypothetical protein BWI93_17090 [Siphonobacter sp. BAB-5385]